MSENDNLDEPVKTEKPYVADPSIKVTELFKEGKTQVGETTFETDINPEEREKRLEFLRIVENDALNPIGEKSPEIVKIFDTWIKTDNPPRITYPSPIGGTDYEGTLYGAVYNHYAAMRADNAY
jgi:hypothetical protein